MSLQEKNLNHLIHYTNSVLNPENHQEPTDHNDDEYSDQEYSDDDYCGDDNYGDDDYEDGGQDDSGGCQDDDY